MIPGIHSKIFNYNLFDLDQLDLENQDRDS